MRNHTKIYFNALGYDETSFVWSELSNKKAADIHHIDCKGMGGDPNGSKDRIEELQALTREEHEYYGDKTHYKAFLYKKHMAFLNKMGVSFDVDYIFNKIAKFESLTELKVS